MSYFKRINPEKKIIRLLDGFYDLTNTEWLDVANQDSDLLCKEDNGFDPARLDAVFEGETEIVSLFEEQE